MHSCILHVMPDSPVIFITILLVLLSLNQKGDEETLFTETKVVVGAVVSVPDIAIALTLEPLLCEAFAGDVWVFELVSTAET